MRCDWNIQESLKNEWIKIKINDAIFVWQFLCYVQEIRNNWNIERKVKGKIKKKKMMS